MCDHRGGPQNISQLAADFYPSCCRFENCTIVLFILLYLRITCYKIVLHSIGESKTVGGILGLCALVDGTYCPVFEPWPFCSSWFSKNFRGLGLRYYVLVSIGRALAVFVKGVFRCGASNDSKIFRVPLKTKLVSGELFLAEGVY